VEKDDFNILIGQALRNSRKELKLTQYDVAVLMDVTFQVISDYERGKFSPTIFWIHKYCIATGYDFGKFLEVFSDKVKVG